MHDASPHAAPGKASRTHTAQACASPQLPFDDASRQATAHGASYAPLAPGIAARGSQTPPARLTCDPSPWTAKSLAVRLALACEASEDRHTDATAQAQDAARAFVRQGTALGGR